VLVYISAVNYAIHILQMPSRTLQTFSHLFRITATHRALPIRLSPNLYTTTRSTSSAISKRLEGKTVLITGASAGIGRSTAKEFARSSPNNLRLILTARRLEKLHELAQEIREEVGKGVKVHTVKLDVSQPQEVSRLVNGLPEKFRSVDILVNNAYELLSPCFQCS
jgi:3-hydroxy acid dehydrogenase/malonic semialdehyde reductase